MSIRVNIRKPDCQSSLTSIGRRHLNGRRLCMSSWTAKSIYIIGSLRNDLIPGIGNDLRAIGLDAFDDWYGAGPEADDYWKEHEQQKGNDYARALDGYAARHVFEFDKYHLDRVDAGLLVLPAGRSGHLELGYISGLGKPSFILTEPNHDRWDVMYCFATKVFFSKEEMIEYFQAE